MTTLNETQEAVLSYLVGLAPVGEAFQCRHPQIYADFPQYHRCYFALIFRQLEAKGALEVIQRGQTARWPVLRVLRRPEAFTVRLNEDRHRDTLAALRRSGEQRRAERAAA